MEALLLAASEDIRMHPLTYTRPKVMLPLANKPIMEHLLLEIKEAGVIEFLVVVGYHGEIVRNYFGNGEKWGITIDYITQRQQQGTASAVKRAECRVGDRFLVINGDIVAKAEDIQKLVNTDKITLILTEVDNPSDLGAVELEDNKIRRIQEKTPKPSSKLVSAGVYLLTPDIFPAITACPASPRGEYELTDALQCLIDSGHPLGYYTTNYWIHPDYPWDLLEANGSFLSKLKATKNLTAIEDNVTIKGKVSIGNGTQIKAGSYIEGPVVIGEKCIIGPCCYLRPGTAIGNNCQIGGTVEIKNSIIMNNTVVANHSFIGDSIIGEDCFIGSGTKIANIRFDGKNIKVAGIDTGRQELGAIIGDKVQTGVNVSIDAGTIIGNNSMIGPGAEPNGVILPNSKIL